MSKEDMEIIVVEKEILFGKEYFEGFKPQYHVDFESRILSNLKSMRRGDAEKDPSHKQPIGYALIINPKTKEVFAYQRSSKDKNYGEKRLQGKWSWGVGGHIEPFDVKIANAENHTLKHVDECNLEHPKIPSKPRLKSRGKIQGFFDSENGNPIRESMLREVIEEELELIGEIKSSSVLGYVNDDSNDVGKVHFGILYLIEFEGQVKPRDSEIAHGRLMSINELEKICSSPDKDVETWSEIALGPLKKYFEEIQQKPL